MKRIITLLLAIIIIGSAGYTQELLKSWAFEENPESIEGSFRMVPGVDGMALKLDGFTTVISEPGDILDGLSESFTIEAWIALAAYPWNWCPVITQMKEETGGFSFDIGPRGELRFKMHTGRNLQTSISDKLINLREWTHIMAVYEMGVGMRLYLNGDEVANYVTKSKPAFAPKEHVRIGMNYDAVFPSNRIGEKGITPYWFSLDGIMDELEISNKAVDSKGAKALFTQFKINSLDKPEISDRHLPTVESNGDFQAYYTQLKYYPEWDDQWPVGPDADIVVTFKDSPVKLIFWRGTRYSPAWVTDNNQWMCDQSVETWNDEEGCKEHMQDRHCKYSHVRLIENTPARKVIHWRYAPVSAYDTHWIANEKTGWEVWVDEYYYIYPDATGIRKVSWKTDYFGRPRQFQETLPLTAAGQTRNDIMEIDYLKIANEQGEQMQLVYTDNPRKEKDLDIINGPNIQQHNFKSDYDPFIIFEPGNRMHYIMDRDIKNLDDPGSCNHWPVGQAYCDGRRTQAADRPAHFLGFPISDPIVHNEDNGRSYWAGLYGMQDSEIEDLVQLSKSWNNAPELIVKSGGKKDARYHRDEKCYIVESTQNRISLEIDASHSRPLVNPAIKIKGFKSSSFEVTLNGNKLQLGQDYLIGTVSKLEGNDAMIYLPLTVEKQMNLLIEAK